MHEWKWNGGRRQNADSTGVPLQKAYLEEKSTILQDYLEEAWDG